MEAVKLQKGDGISVPYYCSSSCVSGRGYLCHSLKKNSKTFLKIVNLSPESLRVSQTCSTTKEHLWRGLQVRGCHWNVVSFVRSILLNKVTESASSRCWDRKGISPTLHTGFSSTARSTPCKIGGPNPPEGKSSPHFYSCCQSKLLLAQVWKYPLRQYLEKKSNKSFGDSRCPMG